MLLRGPKVCTTVTSGAHCRQTDGLIGNVHNYEMSDFGPHHISPKSGTFGFTSPFIAAAPAGHLSSDISSSAEPAGKRRKMSKAKASPIVKRAVSTPQMGGIEEQESGALSPSALDKRRNKLGYQRISIACGHCRRRKIRCVLAEADEHGRCQNCIRLKKECVFYPVDSVGGVESRAQQKSGLGSKSSSVMSNSPSERKPSAMSEGERDFGRFPPLASNAPSDLTSISSGSGLGISTGTSMTTPEFGFDSTASAHEGWHPGVFQHTDSANSESSTTGSWRVQDSPRVGDFSNFPSSDGASSGPYSSYHYPQTRGDYGMQPPLRSMSYSNVEPPMGHFTPSGSASSLDFNRSGSAGHYTLPSTDTVHAPVTSSMIDPAITPVATETMPQFGVYSPQWAYHQQQQQQQSPYPVGMDYSRHDSLQWYHPAQLGQGMDEQTRQQHHHQQQQQWQHQQQQQQQHPQQHHHHHLMPPPGSGYKGNQSPG